MTVDVSVGTGFLFAGRYRLERRIGGGGASVVFRAHDIRLDRAVAVKMFRLDADATSRRRFSDEARLLASLSHPALIDVYDAGEQDGREYLVLQLVEGDTLARRIDDGPLPPVRVAAMGALLAGALAHVHQRGIVHRDVKPSNILCGAGEVFLADFGISRLIGSDPLTGVGVVVGTASYLAPEQVRGQPVGPPADVYALGLVLLECLTARVEYPGPLVESAVARLHRSPSVPDGVPPALAEAIAAMTALDPRSRPSATECVTALLTARASAGSPTPATAGTGEAPKSSDRTDTSGRRATADVPTAAMAAAGGASRARVARLGRHRMGDRRQRRAAAAVGGLAATFLGVAVLAGLGGDPEAAATRRPPQAAAVTSAPARAADSALAGTASAATRVVDSQSAATAPRPVKRTTVRPAVAGDESGTPKEKKAPKPKGKGSDSEGHD